MQPVEHPVVQARRMRGNEAQIIAAQQRKLDAQEAEISELRAAIIEQREGMNELAKAVEASAKPARRGRSAKKAEQPDSEE